MSDPIFAAEMAVAAAARRDRERGRIGDGMAAEGAVPGAPNGWMDFSGAKVPIEPRETPGASVFDLQSSRHVHSGSSECLETVAGGIVIERSGQSYEVPESGWVKCSITGTRLHLHGERLMAHWSRDRFACPKGVAS